jgi:hypothetical protein
MQEPSYFARLFRTASKAHKCEQSVTFKFCNSSLVPVSTEHPDVAGGGELAVLSAASGHYSSVGVTGRTALCRVCCMMLGAPHHRAPPKLCSKYDKLLLRTRHPPAMSLAARQEND